MTPQRRPLPGPRKPYNGPGAAGSFGSWEIPDFAVEDLEMPNRPEAFGPPIRRPKPQRRSARLRIELDVVDVPCDPKDFITHILAPSKRNLRNVEITDG